MTMDQETEDIIREDSATTDTMITTGEHRGIPTDGKTIETIGPEHREATIETAEMGVEKVMEEKDNIRVVVAVVETDMVDHQHETGEARSDHDKIREHDRGNHLVHRGIRYEAINRGI